MNDIIKYESVESKVLTIRGHQVLIDRDVAALYGIETRDVNKAVKNNPDKFPDGYMFEITNQEFEDLRWNISTTNMSRVFPKAFTEKGVYMLATILKSPVATQTTIAIVEAFANIREFNRILKQLPTVADENKQVSLATRAGNAIMEIFDEDLLETTGVERSMELNLPFVKFKQTVKREKRKD